VRLRGRIDNVAVDDVGRVVSMHDGETFYGVQTADGRTAYLPESLVTGETEDDDEYDNTAGDDDAGAPDTKNPNNSHSTDRLNIGSGAATSGLAPNWNGSSSLNLPPANAVREMSATTLGRLLERLA
jgi:hypothetical protein